VDREKKITVKHFLNKNIRHKSNIHGQMRYPLYVRCRYNRIKTEFKSQFHCFLFPGDPIFDDEDMEVENSFTEDELTNSPSFIKISIQNEKEAIQDIIKNHADKGENIVELPETRLIISKYFATISHMLSVSFKHSLQDKLFDYVAKPTFPFFTIIENPLSTPTVYDLLMYIGNEDFKSEVLLPLRALREVISLLDEFTGEFPVLYYHWRFKEAKEDFLRFLRNSKPVKFPVTDFITIIDAAIEEYEEIVNAEGGLGIKGI
jgi:hypothetical protein